MILKFAALKLAKQNTVDKPATGACFILLKCSLNLSFGQNKIAFSVLKSPPISVLLM